MDWNLIAMITLGVIALFSFIYQREVRICWEEGIDFSAK